MAATTKQRLERMLGRLVRGETSNFVFRLSGREFEIWRFEDGTIFIVGVGEGYPRVDLSLSPDYDELQQACCRLTAIEVMEL